MKISYSLGSILSIKQILGCTKILSKNKPYAIWIPETWGMENFSLLSTVSSIIDNTKIGSSIINVYSRSPATIAMGAITVDTISNGRFILGLGVSSKQIIENLHGYEFTNQLLRIKEYVEIIRLIVRGEKIKYNGKIFKLKNFTLLVKPIRKEIPIYLAAVNDKMIKIAHEIADGIILYIRPIDNLRSTIKSIKSKKALDITCQIITCMSNDIDDAILCAKKTLAFYISVGDIYRKFLVQHGFKNEIDEIFNEFLKSGLRLNYKSVTKQMLDKITIYGTPEDCIKMLRKFQRVGINNPIIQFNPTENNIYRSFNLLVDTFSSI